MQQNAARKAAKSSTRKAVVLKSENEYKSLRRKIVLRYVIATVVFLCLLFSTVALRAYEAEQQIKLSQISNEVSSLAQSNESLKIKLSQLKSPQNIENVAKTKLSLVSPSTITELNPPNPNGGTSNIPPVTSQTSVVGNPQ